MRRLFAFVLALALLAGAGYASPAVRYYEAFATLSFARTLRTNGLPAASLPFYSLAMLASPAAAMIPQARGLAYQEMGKHAAAVADFSQAIHLDPKDAGTYGMRAKSLSALSQYDSAIDDYTKVIADGAREDLAYTYVLRGSAHYKLKRLKEAKSDFTRSIEGLPAWPHGYLLLAKAEVEAGDANAALAALNKGEVMVCKKEHAPRACSEQFPKLRQLIEQRGAKG